MKSYVLFPTLYIIMLLFGDEEKKILAYET